MSGTPIFDCEQPLPTRKVRWLPSLLLGFALGGVLIALDRVRGLPAPLILGSEDLNVVPNAREEIEKAKKR